MSGGIGQFGTTYTFDYGGPLINFTLVSAEYTLEPFSVDDRNAWAPDRDHKFLMLHFRVKNPNKDDLYIGSVGLFQVVDANNNIINDSAIVRRESEKARVGVSVKPGQGIPDLVTYIAVPASGPISKLILKMGIAGSHQRVFRYMLGVGKNTVKALPAPYADLSDKTGATALEKIPAITGKPYLANMMSITVDSIELVPGPFGDLKADNGNQFLVATVTAVNRMWGQWYWGGDQFRVALKTDDDKITKDEVLYASRNDQFRGSQLDGGDSFTQRIVIQVPKGTHLKTLSLSLDSGNEGKSREYDYDVSAIK